MTQNLNTIIGQYQAQKASCEAEIQKLNLELAVGENNVKTLLGQAQEIFGTTDINMLNNMLTNLTTEFDAVSAELNNLNNQPQG